MTTEIEPLSRRQALIYATAGLGALTLRPFALQARADERKPLKLLVISDTHLGYRDSDAAQKQWKQTASALAAAPGDLVLHLGDVVDGGREAQYPVYLETRATIGKPVHEIPGNHDPHELFAKHIRQSIDVAVDHDWLRLLLIGNARRDSHDGFISTEQLQWIEKQLAEVAATGRRAILCMHVPAHQNLHPDHGWFVKPKDGQRELYELLQRQRASVIALFHGHFHNGLRGWDDHAPLHEICFPSALYNQDRKLQEQKAPGYNVPEFRPGFTQVEINGPLMKLTYQPLGHDSKAVKELPL